MKHIQNTNNDILVLHKGEELFEQLSTFARQQQLGAAWMRAIGGAHQVTIGFFDPAIKDYVWETFDGPLEIINLQGNMSWVDGEPFWHIHGMFAGRDYRAFGGHVKQVFVEPTTEILITRLDSSMTRVFDDETGIKFLIPSTDARLEQ